MHSAFHTLRSTPTYTSKMCDCTLVTMVFEPVLLWQKYTNPVPFTPVSPSFIWHTNVGYYNPHSIITPESGVLPLICFSFFVIQGKATKKYNSSQAEMPQLKLQALGHSPKCARCMFAYHVKRELLKCCHLREGQVYASNAD